MVEAAGQVHYEFSSANKFLYCMKSFYYMTEHFLNKEYYLSQANPRCILVHFFFRITKNVDKIYLAIKCLSLISHEQILYILNLDLDSYHY